MSGIEERLIREIEVVTRGVVVTESDLSTAREDIIERVGIQRRRDRRRTVAAAAAAAVMIPVLGIAAGQVFGEDDAAQPVSPAPTSPNADDSFLTGEPPTPETVQGFWRVDNNPIMVRLTADGRVSFADNGQLLHEPGLQGSYHLNGDRIDVTVRGGPDECVGQKFALRALPSGTPTDAVRARAARGSRLLAGADPRGSGAGAAYLAAARRPAVPRWSLAGSG